MRKPPLIANAELDRLETWAKYTSGLCKDCNATCCTMPAEVNVNDLIRIGVVDEFERDEPAKYIAKRLLKEGVVEYQHRRDPAATKVALADAVAHVQSRFQHAKGHKAR